jgi:predicted ATPase
MAGLPTGTVTLLFTDIEGSTRLLAERSESYFAALAEHRRKVREAFARHRGVEVDTQGDAFFYAFASARDAVAAAREAQELLSDGPVRVRMGIHTGEPRLTDEGYVGIDVHKGARICGVAHGGQVVLSERSRGLLGAGFLVADLGLHRLKDFDRPEKLFQLGNQAFPPLRSLGATNLPAQTVRIIGRERELEELRSLIREARMVTVTGAGGSGKTTVAVCALGALAPQFTDGVFWVALATIRDPDLVIPTVELTLGAQVFLAEHINEKRTCMLLDNLEQVIECAPALADLLARCPNLHLVVTSRAPLRVRGEREFSLGGLPDEDAVALFGARSGETEPHKVIAAICRRLDGLPLAIELAAARTRLFPPPELLRRLEQSLAVLVRGGRDAPERQRTLRATIEWSHDLLSPEERFLFARLAVFAGGFTLAAAEAVCDADSGDYQSLIEQNLLQGTGERCSMLETVREFAAERFQALEEAEEISRRHLRFFLRLAESANLAAEDDGQENIEAIIREEANTRAALEWALSNNEIELGLRLAVALEHYWVVRNLNEGVRTLQRLLAADRGVPLVLRARALRVLAGNSFLSSDYYEQTDRLYEQSLALFASAGDELGMAVVRDRLGLSAVQRGDTAAAQPLLAESLKTFRRLGSHKGEMQALGHLAYVAQLEGDIDRARVLNERSVEMAAEVGFLWWEAGVCETLAQLALDAGQADEATGWARRSLKVARVLGDRRQMLYALASLSCAAAADGDAGFAGRLWGAIEEETSRTPVGLWETEKDSYVRRLSGLPASEFDPAVQQGRLLTLDAVVDEVLAEDDAESASR